MLILSIDTATPVAGVAIVDTKNVLYEAMANTGYKHSQTLLEMIDAAFKITGTTLGAVDAIAVTSGPGSITGLRIGLAAAKGLALAADKPIIGIPTLEAMAFDIGWMPTILCPVLNARKSEMYAAFYQGGDRKISRLSDELALSPENLAARALLAMQETGNRTVVFTGDGVIAYGSLLTNILGEAAVFADDYKLPRASSSGCLARSRLAGGLVDDIFTLVPTYIRQSEAEVRLAKK